MSIMAAPLGLIARFFGSETGTTSYSYWIQAIFPTGNSPLSAVCTIANLPSGLAGGRRVQLSWNPVPGAIGYNLYGNATTTIPQAGNNLLASLGAETAYTDVTGPTYNASVVKFPGFFVARARYAFGTDGGATGAIIPADSDTIPANAVVFGGYANATIAVTASGSATVAIGTSAGSAANSIIVATGKASWTLDVVLPLLGFNPVAATQSVMFKMTAAGQIQITVATGPLLTGEIEIFVFYTIATKS